MASPPSEMKELGVAQAFDDSSSQKDLREGNYAYRQEPQAGGVDNLSGNIAQGGASPFDTDDGFLLPSEGSPWVADRSWGDHVQSPFPFEERAFFGHAREATERRRGNCRWFTSWA